MQFRLRRWLISSTAAVCVLGVVGRTQSAPATGKHQDEASEATQRTIQLSPFLSPEARDYLLYIAREHPFAGGPSASEDIKGYRAHQDAIMNWFLGPIRKRYPVNVEEQTIDGVFTQIVTPKDGIPSKSRDRVLLNVHGGGFVSGARTASLIESIPIASIEKIKVISIDYRMGPEYKFPAANEDVAAVYSEVLKHYQPGHIGLYGCSAGGMLTSMTIAWFQKHGLPNPAAIGILCASLGDMPADSREITYSIESGEEIATPPAEPGRTPRRGPVYLSNVSRNDPLAFPINSPALLARFPPTLFVTSTAGLEYASALNSDNALVKAGVDAELHVWLGLPHAFWYNSNLPESRDVYNVISDFFDRHLQP
jgi:epsilon-lactone hydrolase